MQSSSFRFEHWCFPPKTSKTDWHEKRSIILHGKWFKCFSVACKENQFIIIQLYNPDYPWIVTHFINLGISHVHCKKEVAALHRMSCWFKTLHFIYHSFSGWVILDRIPGGWFSLCNFELDCEANAPNLTWDSMVNQSICWMSVWPIWNASEILLGILSSLHGTSYFVTFVFIARWLASKNAH